VVHLKIGHRATGLTPPAVATQDLLAQSFVGHRVHRNGETLGPIVLMMPLRRVSRKACRCSPGKVSFRKSRGEKSLRLLRSFWASATKFGKVWIGSLRRRQLVGRSKPIEDGRYVRLTFAYDGACANACHASICIRLARACWPLNAAIIAGMALDQSRY